LRRRRAARSGHPEQDSNHPTAGFENATTAQQAGGQAHTQQHSEQTCSIQQRRLISGYSSLIGSSLTSVLEAAEGSKSSKASPDLSETAGTGFSLLLSSGKQAALLDDINFMVESVGSLAVGSDQHEAALVKLAVALLSPSAANMLRSNQQLAAAVIKATASALPSQRGATWDTIPSLPPLTLQAVGTLAYLLTASPLNVMRCTRAFVRLLLLASRDATLQAVESNAIQQPAAAPAAVVPAPLASAAPSQPVASLPAPRKSRINKFRRKAETEPLSAEASSATMPAVSARPAQDIAAPSSRPGELVTAWARFWARTQPPKRRLAAVASDQVDPVVYVPVAPGGHDAILQRFDKSSTDGNDRVPACLAPLALVRLLSIMDVPQRNLRKQVQSVVAARSAAAAAPEASTVTDEQLQAAETAYVAAVNGARKVVIASQGFRLLCSVLRRGLLGVLRGGPPRTQHEAGAVATCVLCCFEQLAQEGESTQMAMSNTRVTPSACQFTARGFQAGSGKDTAAQLMSELSLVSLLLSIPYHTVHPNEGSSLCSIKAGLPLLATRVLVNIANENGTTARVVASSAPAIFRPKRANGRNDGLTMLHVSADEGALGRQWPGLATIMALVAHASSAVSAAAPGAKAVDAFDVLITATVAATNLVERCPALQYAVVFGPDGDVEPAEQARAAGQGGTPTLNGDSQGGMSTFTLSVGQSSWLSQVAVPFAERFGDLEAFLDETEAPAPAPAQETESKHGDQAASTPQRAAGAAKLAELRTPKSPREHGVTAQDVVAAAYLALLLACCCQHSPQTTEAALSAVAFLQGVDVQSRKPLEGEAAVSTAASALVTTLKSFVRLQSSAGVLTEQVLTRIASVIEKLQSLIPDPAVLQDVPVSMQQLGTAQTDDVVLQPSVGTSSPAGPTSRPAVADTATAPPAKDPGLASAASWLQPIAPSRAELVAVPSSWAALKPAAGRVGELKKPAACNDSPTASASTDSQSTEINAAGSESAQAHDGGGGSSERAATPPPSRPAEPDGAFVAPPQIIVSPARSVISVGSRNSALSVSPLKAGLPPGQSAAGQGVLSTSGGRLSLSRAGTAPAAPLGIAVSRKRAFSPNGATRGAAAQPTSHAVAGSRPPLTPPTYTPPLRRASSEPSTDGTPGSGSRGSSRAAKAARLAAVMSGRGPVDRSPGYMGHNSTRRVLSPATMPSTGGVPPTPPQPALVRRGSSRAGALSAAVAHAAAGLAVSGDSASSTPSSAAQRALAKAASPAIARAAMRAISHSQSTLASGSSSHGSTSAVLSRSTSSGSGPRASAVPAPLQGSQLADSVFGKPKTYSRRRRGFGGNSASGAGISPGSSLSSAGFAAKNDHLLDEDENLDDLLF